MASLKEIRSRILSVTSTKKITSAMKMVSAAKLKKAQNAIEKSLPYMDKLSNVLQNFIASMEGDSLQSALSEVREVKCVAIVLMSSDGSLCGAFNNNVIKKYSSLYEELSSKLGAENVLSYPIGEKAKDAMKKRGITPLDAEVKWTDDMDYEAVGAFVDRLMTQFVAKEIDEVIVIYNHFKNAGIQLVREEKLLPFVPEQSTDAKKDNVDYIVEPGRAELVNTLIPKFLRLRLFTMALDSIAAEHGARTTAMQIATDNAEDLVQQLTLSYNKLRQAAITNEIITIIGGAEAIK